MRPNFQHSLRPNFIFSNNSTNESNNQFISNNKKVSQLNTNTMPKVLKSKNQYFEMTNQQMNNLKILSQPFGLTTNLNRF